MEVKVCSKCKETKVLSEFNTRPDRITGYRSECKKCQYKAHHQRYLKQKKKVYAKGKAFTAYKKGELNKPLFCENCGEVKPLDKHHPDYDKPLKIVWVCRRCHTKLHSLMGSYNKAV